MTHPLSTVLAMAIHLTVGAGLASLVEPLADVLSQPPSDLFAPQVVAIPGEGVRSWLTWRLAEHLGGPAGIVANIEWVFPATIGRRALGFVDRHDPWGVDTLTWSVHTVLHQAQVPGVPVEQGDLARSRAIADLFDRYALRRSGMVAAWERGHDVDALGRPLAQAQRWQPALWRALVQYYGGPSSAVAAHRRLEHLIQHGPDAAVPDRFVVVGITGLAWFQLETLAAIGAHREVHLLSPVPSPDLWQRVGQVVQRLRTGEGSIELTRTDDPTAHLARHPLMRSWGRSTREAQHNVASVLGSVVSSRQVGVAPSPTTFLGALQAALRADRHEAATTPEIMDATLHWHRCHGSARQAEVARDAVLHLLERRHDDGTPQFEPRDIAVLCTDIATFGPLLEAAFAGAPEHGVPDIPLRIADRTLGGEAPLVDVATALAGLLERRWRRDEVLDLARLPAVRRRFGLASGDLGMVEQWLGSASVRWGLAPEDHHRAGLPDALHANTMQSGLDQLFVGAALNATAMCGPSDVAPTGDLEGDDLAVLGAFTEFVECLAGHVETLCQPATAPRWITRLRAAITDLARLAESDAWQWGALDRELTAMADAARLGDPHHAQVLVDPEQLAKLVVARLAARPGRPRFDTGAVTVSSLAGQRGVPRAVVVLVGLDEALLSGGVVSADDLVAATPFVGDPDPRAEVRAQLLDAVLAAQHHLVLVSTGFDVRTNDEVAPAVALAELVDSVDQLAGGTDARRHWVIDHPRQPWHVRSFLPGELGEPGAWTFHRGFATLLEQAGGPRHRRSVLAGTLARETGDRTLSEVIRGITSPVEALLRDRCAIALPDTRDQVSTVLPLGLEALDAWNIRDDVLGAVLAAHPGDDVEALIREQLDLVRRRGALPALALGDATVAELRQQVAQLITFAEGLGASLGGPGLTIDVDTAHVPIGQRRLVGRIADVRGHQMVRLTASNHRGAHLLAAWVELAALTVMAPHEPWHAIVVGRTSSKAGATGRRLALRSSEAAIEILATVIELTDRARCEVLPLGATLSEALYRKGAPGMHSSWNNDIGGGLDRYIEWAVGDTDLDELLHLPNWPDAVGDTWPEQGGRLEVWAHRLWNTFDTTTSSDTDEGDL